MKNSHFLRVAWFVFLAMLAVTGLSAAVLYPNLPDVATLKDYRPKEPLRVYTEDGALIGEFGEEKRSVVAIKNTPKILRDAILAAEDERFYDHGGVDSFGVLRAAVSNVLSGSVKEGASTITMQVARNFFLSSEKSFKRKINEALLAVKIENALSKDEILELYINQIYLGQRAYGFEAAARVYFGKPLNQIDIAEAAMLAGLPKAPSAYNPVVNFPRAKLRQQYVLKRLRDLKWISETEFEQAQRRKLVIRYTPQSFDAAADHLAELVRQYMFQKYGEQIYQTGMRVYTTLRIADQKAAVDAVRAGVVEYTRRRGYPGAEAQMTLPTNASDRETAIADALAARGEVNGLLPGIVMRVDAKRIRVRLRGGDEIDLGPTEIEFAKAALGAKATPARRLRPGSVVRVVRFDGQSTWLLTALPQVEAALVSMSPETGAIRAMVGGFDFVRSQYNHVTQALRQPGSTFKPFIYSAALERGITPATIFEDAPVRINPALTGGVEWNPQNYDREMEGSMTLRRALYKSKNLVSIRVLDATGVEFAQQHALRFGFPLERVPALYTLALGANEATPLEMAVGYAVFANGGSRVMPHYLLRVTDKNGRVLENFTTPVTEPVLDPRNAFVMTTLLQDVVRRGTAVKAMELGRLDLAGKTGTTDDTRDTWFAGYAPTRVAVAWLGYDQPRPTGETGGVAALPIWTRYMEKVLRQVPDVAYAPPEGVSVHTINPATGRPDGAGVPEYFLTEYPPGSPLPARR
jgi:penicillin-binding protein 1A